MYIRCVDKNVNLEMLISEVKSFFEHRGFSVEQIDENEKIRLMVKVQGSSKVIEIILEGSPENFSVEGIFVEGQPLYVFTSMFGGGAFFLQELKLRERLQNLEKEFSRYLENVVIRMRNSNISDDLG